MDETGRKITAPIVRARGRAGDPIVMVTAYDATFARLADQAGVDIVLVGDSLGMVVQGQADTLTVTLDEMIYHTRAVARAVSRAQVVLDLPFMSYQVDPAQALASAGRALKEGGAAAVKLEGGRPVLETVRRIVDIGIPVMGHLGLTPQSVHAMGGFKVQARDAAAADRLLEDALALQSVGCYSLVLEGVPSTLAERVTAALEIPTIGIGAGPRCRGQVLVMHDLLGLEDRFKPKFVKRYAELAGACRDAFSSYAAEVRSGAFPTVAHSFGDGPAMEAATASGGGDGGAQARAQGPNAPGGSAHTTDPADIDGEGGEGGYGPR